MNSFFNLNADKIDDIKFSKHDESQRYHALGVFCIYTLFALCIFDYIILITHTLKSYEAMRITIFFVILLFGFFFFRMVRKTGFPLKMFGITLINAKRSVIESIIFSILVCLLLLFLKWALIRYDDFFSHVKLFTGVQNPKDPHHLTMGVIFLLSFLYILFVPLQSFILHSAWQSSLMIFLPERQNVIIPILLTSFAFGSVHTDFNLIFALLVMLITLFWATMYARHRTLIGVTLSHMIVGLFALDILHMTSISQVLSDQLFGGRV